MNKYFASITPVGTVKYPMHKHNTYEVMCYLEGSGYLATEHVNIPFDKGSIIIVPPGVLHGSVSKEGFRNVSVGGDFNNMFFFNKPTLIRDDANSSGEMLAKLILNNYTSESEYLLSLINTYAYFILKSSELKNPTKKAISQIISQISEGFTDTDFDVTDVLNKSGYAEDYMRSEFKKMTGRAPVAYLNELRLRHAAKLLEIYSANISISELSYACGFSDPVYFSKKFKDFTGISPLNYQKKHFQKEDK